VNRTVIAAFDFDGTLINGDSLLPFLLKVAGTRRLAMALLRSSPTIGSRDRFKQNVLEKLIAGRTEAALRPPAEDYGRSLLKRIRPDVLAQLRYHQNEGHTVVLVSASPTLYLDELCRQLGIVHNLSTRLEISDGRLTGRLDGGNCRGFEKVRRLREFVGEAPCDLYTYADARSDRPLMDIATHAVWIRRRPLSRGRGVVPP
jgi:phosphatidylglycerophosphatase C